MKAFPNGVITNSDGLIVGGQPGMDLRDYFAAKVMQYWLCNPIDITRIEKLCENAYQVADAMMKAREQ